MQCNFPFYIKPRIEISANFFQDRHNFNQMLKNYSHFSMAAHRFKLSLKRSFDYKIVLKHQLRELNQIERCAFFNIYLLLLKVFRRSPGYC